MMDCRHVEDIIPAYALDALEPEEGRRVEEHFEGCDWCSGLVRTHLEVAATLSLAAEQKPPPKRVLAGIVKRAVPVQAEPAAPPPQPYAPQRRRPATILAAFLYAAAPIALLLLGGVLAFTLRTSGQMGDLQQTNDVLTRQVSDLQQDNDALSGELSQLMDENSRMAAQVSKLNDDSSMVSEMSEKVNRLSEENTVVTAEVTELVSGNKTLSQQMDALTVSGRELLEFLRMQRAITYMLTLPNTMAMNLEAQPGAEAQGSLMLNFDREWGIFVATGLPLLPATHQYDIWMSAGDREYYVGALAIDETGWGVAYLAPDHAMAEYQWIGVTVEFKTASPRPSRSGEPVLWGSLALVAPLYP